jgi:hypothetical protein
LKPYAPVFRPLSQAFSLICLLVSLACLAQSQSLQGDWNGTLSVPNGSLPLVFHLQGGGNGTVDSPRQNFTGQLHYSVSGNQITITVPQVGGRYSATVNGDQMTGSWSQNGANLNLTLAKSGTGGADNGSGGNGNTNPAAAGGLQGDWSGTLNAPNGNLPLVFHLDGNGGGTVDSLAQNFTGQLQYSVKGNQMTIVVPQVGGRYSGVLNGNQMTGTWSQNGGNLPLALSKKTGA